MRNICAHYGRVWNRTFDVLIDAPGQARKDSDHPLSPLVGEGTNNRFYGVLFIMRYLFLSIALAQFGSPEDWRSNPVWARDFVLDPSAMLVAGLLDRVDNLTAPLTRAALTSAEPKVKDPQRTPVKLAAAKRGAQKSLLRTYLQYRVVIEIEFGQTKYYPVFQFWDGKIIDALAEINRELAAACAGADPTRVAAAFLDWWQTPHPDLPEGTDGVTLSPLDLLESVPEASSEKAVCEANATGNFVPPDDAVK